MTTKVYISIIAGLVVILAGTICFYEQHECPVIIRKVVEEKIRYVSSSPIEIPGEPINNPIHKPKPQIIHDTVAGKKDTFYKYVIQPNQSTFTNVDTAMSDSLGVAIAQVGNCLGIQSSKFTFFGKQKVITKTITNNIVIKPKPLYLFVGVNNMIENKQITEVTPNAMLMYKGRFGVEYGYGLLNNSHNVGLKIRIK